MLCFAGVASAALILAKAAVSRSVRKMKLLEPQVQSGEVQCPCCKAAMQLVRHIDLKGLPDIYFFYCNGCQHVETVTEDRAA
jgi:hypothetical protein